MLLIGSEKQHLSALIELLNEALSTFLRNIAKMDFSNAEGCFSLRVPFTNPDDLRDVDFSQSNFTVQAMILNFMNITCFKK